MADNDSNALQAEEESLLSSRRRSAARNSIITPTRTLRLTTLEEQQQANNNTSRDTTPIAIAEGIIRASVVTRRSPRQQRRFESPLENEPIRGGIDNDDDDGVTRRITIRPMAGNLVGGVLARNRGMEGEEDTTTSNNNEQSKTKLTHSHRKLRRWNNDRLVDLDISSAKVRQIFAEAKNDAHHYKAIVNPLLDTARKNAAYKRFMTDKALKTKREAFFEGIGPNHLKQHPTETRPKQTNKNTLQRIDVGLRRLVERSHRNSAAASKVLALLEECVVSEYYDSVKSSHKNLDADPKWWKDLLLEAPKVSISDDNNDDDDDSPQQHQKKTVEFKFPLHAQSGGFHRLLLSAIAQFHGIKAQGKNRSDTRAMILVSTSKVKLSSTDVPRLVDVLSGREEENNKANTTVALNNSSPVSSTEGDDGFSLLDESVSTYVLVSDEEEAVE